jgi:Zn-dependent protease
MRPTLQSCINGACFAVSVDDEPSGHVLSYPTFTEMESILSEDFQIMASAVEYGSPVFLYRWKSGVVPEAEAQRTVFERVHQKCKSLRIWPIVRWKDKKQGIYYTRFIPEERQPKSDTRINKALFIATLASITLGGFMQASSDVFLAIFYPQGYTVWDIVFTTGIFIVALMGIIGTHEMGHYMMAKHRGIDATPPYFIPGIPQIGGTFGAFIQQKTPPKNRSDLFDLGIAGPVAGFVITLIALVVGFLLSVPITAGQLAAIDATYGASGSLPVPLVFNLLEIVFGSSIPAGGTIYLHPVGFAAWVGCLVTALNLFPSGQLDGGHALRAVTDDRVHRIIGYVAIGVMLLAGFILMAVLVFAMSYGRGHPGALDDTVPVTKGRLLMFVVAMIILIISIPPISLEFF